MTATTLGRVACTMFAALLLLVSGVSMPQAATVTDLGAQQLSANSANVHVTRLHNELCDVVQYLHDLGIGDLECHTTNQERCDTNGPTKNRETLGTPCLAEDEHDLAPSNKLLTRIKDPPRQALLAFQWFVETFCEQGGSSGELAQTLNCWRDVPNKLEAIRLASERLYTRAGESDGRALANNDATRLAQEEGERSLLSLAVLGRQWAKSQFVAATGPTPPGEVQFKCGAGNKATAIPPEIDRAYRQLSEFGAGEKLRRVTVYFKGLESPISRAAEALSRNVDTSGLDRLCELAAAVDLRTNSRFEQFLAQPDLASDLSADAKLVAEHRRLICKENNEADKAGFCQPEPGDNTAVLSNYLRSSLRSWNKAQKILKGELNRLDVGTVRQQLMEDRVWAKSHDEPDTFRNSLVIVNLIASKLAKDDPREIDVSDTTDTRSLLGRLATRLGTTLTQSQPSPTENCKPIGVPTVLKFADSLATDLIDRLRAMDDAVGTKSKEDPNVKPRTAQEVRVEIIEQTKILLRQKVSSVDLQNIGTAIQQLSLLSERIELGELSTSGNGLIFSATLQSICLVDDKVELKLALSLESKINSKQQDGMVGAGTGRVLGSSLSSSLRRSLAVTFDLQEFRSALIQGDLVQELKSTLTSHAPHEFTMEIVGLCILGATLNSTNANSDQLACHWPSSIPLPAGAKVTLDSDLKRATIEVPDWVRAALPEECGKPLIIAQQADISRTLACLNHDLKAVENTATKLQAGLGLLVGKQLDNLRIEANKALRENMPKPLSDLIGINGAFASCLTTMDVVVADTAEYPASRVLDDVRRSVAMVDRQIFAADTDRLAPLPVELPVIELRSELSIASCFNALDGSAGTRRRTLGIWREESVKWSRILRVKLPRFGVGTQDPLAAWDDALGQFRAAGSASVLVLDKPRIVKTTGIERQAIASSLLESGHFELCPAASGKGEDLRFWVSPLTSKDEADLPCMLREAGPGVAVATGDDFRSLKVVNSEAVLSSISGRLNGDLGLKLDNTIVQSGADLAANARGCAGSALGAPNTISFNLNASSFQAVGSKQALKDLQVVVGWSDKQPAIVAFLAKEPLEKLGDVVASIAGTPRGSVKIMGFVAKGNDIQPCIVGPTPIILAANLGEKFFEGLLATDVGSVLSGLAGTASAVDQLRLFIRDQQPSGKRYQDTKDASGTLALKLNVCRPDDVTGQSLNCDYQINFLGGCTAVLRIDEKDYGPGGLVLDEDRIKLKGDCEPEALSAILGSTDAAPELPVHVTKLKLLVDDSIKVLGKLAARSAGGGVAATACAKELENVDIDFVISMSGSTTFKANGLSALSKCAQAYATGKIADSFLPPNLKQNTAELRKRIQSAAKEWFDGAAKSGFGKCDPTNIKGWLNVTCTSVKLAEAQLKADWKEVSSGWCKTIAGPIQSVLDAADVKTNATEECQAALKVNCEAKNVDPMCSIVVGANYAVELTPLSGPVVSAAASFTLPDVFKITSCFGGKGPIEQSAGFLHLSLVPVCNPGESTIKLSGSISLLESFPWKVPPAQLSLSYDLKTGKASANVNSPNWKTPLNEAMSKAINGQTLGVDSVKIRTDTVTLDDDDRAVVSGTLILDWGQHIEAPGFKIIFDLKNGTVRYEKPSALDTMITDVLKRFASAVSIPGALKVDINRVRTNAKSLPESVDASVTVDAQMFKATLPPLTIDKSGVRFGKPFQITLQFNAEIPIPPVSLSNIRGTISEKFLSLGADATLMQSAIAYILKAQGDFTLPFDLRDDITAIEQMVAFSVVPLGKSTSRINVHEPMMSRTIEIGGALKPIIWLFGEAKINKERLTGNTNFAVFGADLAKADLNADFKSGLVDARGNADIGIGDLSFVFNGKQFALNPRLQLNGNIHVGSFSLSSFAIRAKLDSAAVKFKVIGISLGFVAPSLKNVTGDMLKKLIEDLLSFDLKDLGKALEAILSGNLTINPFSHFGKDDGNGVANGDGTGAEDGEEGDNGGGSVGSYPAASQVLAEQGPQGTPASEESKASAGKESQAATEMLSEKAIKDGAQPGDTKALLNPEGKLVMQFFRTANTITGDLAPPGQTNAAPLLAMQLTANSSPYFVPVGGDTTRLKSVKTPILLDRDIFVAADASNHLFLPKEPRNEAESPIKGLCSGNVSEVDLLLFSKDSDANQPKRLPAGLLGLCLSGLKEIANRPVASDLLLGALRVASIALTGQGSRSDEAKSNSNDVVSPPLRSAWFQCNSANDKKTRFGLAMLLNGELASRIIVSENKELTYFRMTGFPYADPERVGQACQLLSTAEKADERRPIDFIVVNDRKDPLLTGRMARGELKFDKEWIPLDPPAPPLPPLVQSARASDPFDPEIWRAIDRQNEDSRAPSREPAKDTVRMGDSLCVVNKDNAPFLAQRSSLATPFLALDTAVFSFSDGKITFPGFTVANNACSQVDSDRAALVYAYVDADAPLMGRFARQGGICALEVYWTEGDAKKHAGLKISESLCAAKASNLAMFNRAMGLVIRQLRLCMGETADKGSCVEGAEGALAVGGGWSDAERVIISETSQPTKVLMWGGDIPLNYAWNQYALGKPLRGEAQSLKAFVNRAWESPSMGAVVEWISRQTDTSIELLHLSDNSASFTTKSGALKLDLKTGKKTEFHFISGLGLNTKEIIGKVVDQLTDVPLANEPIDVALISNNSGLITFAIKQADGKWEEHRPAAAATRIISDLVESDLSPAFGRALIQLASEPREIKVARNAKSILVAGGSEALVVGRGEKACAEPLFSTGISEQTQSKLIELWLQDFALSLIQPSGKCLTAALLDTKPVLMGTGDGQLLIFDYAAGTLAAKPAAHVLASDGRAFRLLRETGASDDLLAAERSVLQFALREKRLPRKVALLGKIGRDKLRFDVDSETTGLAGANFVCPLKNSDIFAKVSPVINAFLLSVNEKCQQADFQLDRAGFARMSSSAGEVDVLIAPRPSEPRSWSVHFGSPTFTEDRVASAKVTLPDGTNDASASSLLLPLARRWFEWQAESVGSGFPSEAQFDIRRYCDREACVAVAFAANAKQGVFVAALNPINDPQFWMTNSIDEIGGDPFADLGDQQGAAIALVRKDLDFLARGDRSATDAAGIFCVVRHDGVILWPSLSAAGGSSRIRSLAYQELGKGSLGRQIVVFSEGRATCGWLREVLGSNFHNGLKTVLAMGSMDVAPREVWLASESKTSEVTYERANVPECRVFSDVSEIDTFAALDRRPARLTCPTKLKLFRRVIDDQAPTPVGRLVIYDRSSETAWVATGNEFKQIRMTGNASGYTDEHWRLLQETDLAADGATVSRMVPLVSNEFVRLLVLSPSRGAALLSSRSLQNKVMSKQDVKTIGLPANTDDPVVRTALDELQQRGTVPVGIVFHTTPPGAVPQFWMLENDLKSVTLFRGAEGQRNSHLLRMVNVASKDIDGVMSLLSKADPRIAEVVEQSDKDGRPPILRISGNSFAVVTRAKLVVQEESNVQTVMFSPAIAGRDPQAMPILEPLLVLLANNPQRCVGAPCNVGGDQRFVLIDSKDAFFGMANKPYGHAAIIGDESRTLMTSLESVLGVGRDELFESQNSVLVLLPVGEGFLADRATRLGLAFSQTISRNVKLRESFQENFEIDLSKVLSRFDGHFTERLSALPEDSALGFTKSDDRLPFVCGDKALNILESLDWIISAQQVDIQAFCSAIETDKFNVSEKGAWDLAKRDTAFILFKQVGESYSIRMWEARRNLDRRLTLPFKPTSVSDQPLEREARNSAFACDEVTEVKAVGSAFWFAGKSGVWPCKLQLNSAGVPLAEPSLLIEASGPNAKRVTASAPLPPKMEPIAAVEGEILRGLAARVAKSCPSVEHVTATVGQGARPVLTYQSKAGCQGVLAWQPSAAGAVPTLVGAAVELNALTPIISTGSLDLPGPSLFLERFVDQAGIVVSDRDPQHETLSIVRFGPGAQPIVRSRDGIANAWKRICEMYALGADCPKITPFDLAEATLLAGLNPQRGRTINFKINGVLKTFTSPVNVGEFLMSLPAN